MVLEDYTGEAVINIAKTRKPDLILLDLILPGKEGFVVLKELKDDPVAKLIPVVVISKLAGAKDIREGQALGADKYLVKGDTSFQRVIATVKEYLG